MIKIVLSYCHFQGWGDSLVSIFDILNLTDFLRNKYSNLYITLVINDIRSLNIKAVLNEVLDLNFFDVFFDDVIIQDIPYSIFNNNGICSVKGHMYKKIYSGRNDDISNNVPGIFDVYVETNALDTIDISISDCKYFTYDEIELGKTIKNFPIFNPKIIDYSESFIRNNLSSEFEAIYYRANEQIDVNKINNLISKVNKNLTYFLCSNSSEVKKIISSFIPNSKMIRGFDNQNYHLSGCPMGINQLNDAFFSVCELYTLSRCKTIYYDGELSWVSFFVWYPRNVCNVKVIT